MQAQWVDIAILSIIGLSILTGLMRGFMKEVIALCIWILAVWLAYNYTQTVEPWLQPYLHDKTMRSVASFVLILAGTLLCGALVNIVLSFALKRSGLSSTDRILGMGFGLVRGVFLVAVIILALQMTSIPHEDYAKQSRLYAQFDPVVHWLYGYVPDFIKQMKVIDKQNIADLVVEEDAVKNLDAEHAKSIFLLPLASR